MPDPILPTRPLRAPWEALLTALALMGLSAGCGGDLASRMAEVRALQDVGQFRTSIDALREILAVSPDDPEAAYRLGVALVHTGESSRAVWALQKAAESPAYAVVAGLLLASSHLDNENFEECVRAADRVLEADPERQLALQLRAKGNIGAGRYAEALADAQRLVELQPEDYTARAIHASALAEAGVLDEAHAAFELLKEMGEASGDPALAPRACLAPALFAHDELDDPERAERLYADCIARHPTDPTVIHRSVLFLDAIDERERATEIVRAAVTAAPENLQLRSMLAHRLGEQGETEAAEQVLKQAAERFQSAAAWNLLASFYRKVRRPEQALAAIEKVIDLTGGGDPLRFTQADVLVDLGELQRAEEVAGALSEPTYATLIRGRILLERGDARGALEAFEQGIRSWPNNAGARYLAGLAARRLGDHERAISELRESVRADASATPAALLLARIHLDRREYGAAAAMAMQSLAGPGGRLETQSYVVAARALTALGRHDRARESLQAMETLTGESRLAAVERAAVAHAEQDAEAAVQTLERSGFDPLDPANLDVLRALARYEIELGRGASALARLDAASARSPEDADLHALRGSVLARAGRIDAARAAFGRALALDADHAAALAGGATLAANAGETDRAIRDLDRAAQLDPDQPDYAYAAAQLALASGDPSARERLEALVRASPGHAGGRNDLAWLLASRGQELDRALALAEEARRLDPSPEVLDTLGWVHLKRGEPHRAASVLAEALELQPDSPTLLYHLAVALKEVGEEESARQALERALETPPAEFPDAEAATLLLAELGRP